MLNKYTIIGLVAGCIISGLGVASMIDSLANPIEIRPTNDTFGIAIQTKLDLMRQQTLFKHSQLLATHLT